MQNKRKSHKKRKLGLALILFGIVLSLVIILVTQKIEPSVSGICDYKSRIYAYDLINESIEIGLKEKELSCSDFLELVTDSSGNITAINTNMINANDTINRISNLIENQKNGKIFNENIKVGSLLGIGLMYDKGFNIPLTIEPQGWVETNIISNFTETGINQTTIEIVLEIKMTVSSQLPMYSKATEVTVETPIAETMIIGKIPDYIGSGVIARSPKN